MAGDKERRKYDDNRTTVVVKATVREMLEQLGVYMDKEGIQKFRDDMSFLSDARTAYKRVRVIAWAALLLPIGTFITSRIEAIQAWFESLGKGSGH